MESRHISYNLFMDTAATYLRCNKRVDPYFDENISVIGSHATPSPSITLSTDHTNTRAATIRYNKSSDTPSSDSLSIGITSSDTPAIVIKQDGVYIDGEKYAAAGTTITTPDPRVLTLSGTNINGDGPTINLGFITMEDKSTEHETNFTVKHSTNQSNYLLPYMINVDNAMIEIDRCLTAPNIKLTSISESREEREKYFASLYYSEGDLFCDTFVDGEFEQSVNITKPSVSNLTENLLTLTTSEDSPVLVNIDETFQIMNAEGLYMIGQQISNTSHINHAALSFVPSGVIRTSSRLFQFGEYLYVDTTEAEKPKILFADSNYKNNIQLYNSDGELHCVVTNDNDKIVSDVILNVKTPNSSSSSGSSMGVSTLSASTLSIIPDENDNAHIMFEDTSKNGKLYCNNGELHFATLDKSDKVLKDIVLGAASSGSDNSGTSSPGSTGSSTIVNCSCSNHFTYNSDDDILSFKPSTANISSALSITSETNTETSTTDALINYLQTIDDSSISFPALRFNDSRVEISSQLNLLESIHFVSTDPDAKDISLYREADNLFMKIGTSAFQLNPVGTSGSATTTNTSLSDNNVFTGTNTFNNNVTFGGELELYQTEVTNQITQINNKFVVGSGRIWFADEATKEIGTNDEKITLQRWTDGLYVTKGSHIAVNLLDTSKTITHLTNVITDSTNTSSDIGLFCVATGEIYDGYSSITHTDCICKVRPTDTLSKSIVGIITAENTFATHGDCLVRISPDAVVEIGDILVPSPTGAKKATNDDLIYMMSQAIPRPKITCLNTGIEGMVATILL